MITFTSLLCWDILRGVLMKIKKLALIATTVLSLSSIAVPFVYTSPSTTVQAATTTKPVNYNQWKTIRSQKLSVSQTKQLARDVEKGRALGNFVMFASTWVYKIPALGASIGTMGYLMSSQGGTIISAAQKNKGITLTYQQKVNWDGYSPRTRILIKVN